ncbi:MAG: hypothetical protein ACRDPC_13210 [Solirubrobacteraceae bacterium]
MTSGGLPREARWLVQRQVHSVGELDLLVLLHSDRARSWSVQEVCETLWCPDTWAEIQLEALRTGGLAEVQDGRWRFAPAEPALERATDALADAYRTRKADVVRLVFARGDDLDAFADAFRLRRDEED